MFEVSMLLVDLTEEELLILAKYLVVLFLSGMESEVQVWCERPGVGTGNCAGRILSI